jgi:hypothetical protein
MSGGADRRRGDDTQSHPYVLYRLRLRIHAGSCDVTRSTQIIG